MSVKPRPEGLDHPKVPSFIRFFSKVNVAIFKATGGRLGNRWRVGAAFPRGVPVCLLTTVGRKTGEKRTAPLIYLEDGPRVVVVASQGGLPGDPLWYKNLVAHPMCEVQTGRAPRTFRARTANPSERAALWPRLVALYSDYASYATWTTREIPVVILDPM